jgi:hypothetical protein
MPFTPPKCSPVTLGVLKSNNYLDASLASPPVGILVGLCPPPCAAPSPFLSSSLLSSGTSSAACSHPPSASRPLLGWSRMDNCPNHIPSLRESRHKQWAKTHANGSRKWRPETTDRGPPQRPAMLHTPRVGGSGAEFVNGATTRPRERVHHEM